MREQLDETRRALYERIAYPLGWILQEGAEAHVDRDNIADSTAHRLSRPRHETERECHRWERATLRKIIVFARPPAIDLEASEYDVARWADQPETLGYIEAQKKLFAARAAEIRKQFFGLRARCPLCGGTPQQDSSGYAWPEGLSRHLEGHGNVGRCSVIRIAFAACRRARRESLRTRVRPLGPATCHPNLPAYEDGHGECENCYQASWKVWHESIDAEVAEWASRLCHQLRHSWSPDVCVRCGTTRCRTRYSNGERCAHAIPCREHAPPAPVSLEEWRRGGKE
jgi:hypothetical protein